MLTLGGKLLEISVHSNIRATDFALRDRILGLGETTKDLMVESIIEPARIGYSSYAPDRTLFSYLDSFTEIYIERQPNFDPSDAGDPAAGGEGGAVEEYEEYEEYY